MQFGGIVNHDDFYQMDDSDVGENGDAGMRITASSGSGISVPHVQVNVISINKCRCYDIIDC